MLCGLFLSSYLLRLLGDTEYGVYQTVSSFANYLVLLEFGTGTVMARNISACRAKGCGKEEIDKNISTIWTITNVFSFVILLVSCVFYTTIDLIYRNSMTAQELATGKQMFVFIVVFLIASFYSHTINGIALAHENYAYSSTVSIIRILSRTLFLAALVFLFKKAIVIAIVDAALNSVLAVFGYFYSIHKYGVKINMRSFDYAILKAAFPMCVAIFLQAIVNQANNTVGKFVLGIVEGPESVAVFSVALYVFSMFSSLTTIPISLYMPQVTRDILAGCSGLELTKKLVQPCRLIVIVGGSLLFGFFAIGRQFVSILYGEERMIAWQLAIILMVPMFFNMANAVVINVLDVRNKRLVRSCIMMVTTAINVAITIVLIQRVGIVGASWGTAVATLLQTIVLNIYYAKAMKLKIPYMFLSIFRGILPFQLMGGILGYLVGRAIENPYIAFLLGGITFCVVFFLGFLLFGKSEEEKAMFGKIKKKFFEK